MRVKWEDYERPTYMPLETALEDVPELAWKLIKKTLSFSQESKKLVQHGFQGCTYF